MVSLAGRAAARAGVAAGVSAEPARPGAGRAVTDGGSDGGSTVTILPNGTMEDPIGASANHREHASRSSMSRTRYTLIVTGSRVPNFTNRLTWTRDNFSVLPGLNSESVNLVYADPPFNSNKNSEAPIGSKAAGVPLNNPRALSDIDIAWHGGIADRERKVYAAIDTDAVCGVPAGGEWLRTSQPAAPSSVPHPLPWRQRVIRCSRCSRPRSRNLHPRRHRSSRSRWFQPRSGRLR